MHLLLRSARAALFSAIVWSAAACSPASTVPIAQALEDRDSDGWFSPANNMAVSLSLVSGTFPAGGAYAVFIDDVRFPLAADLRGSFIVPPFASSTGLGSATVATRVRGVRGFPSSGTPFGATVRVVLVPPLLPGVDLGTARVPFGETSGALAPVVIGGVTLNFSVSLSPFADPNPDDANGDTDADGIGEQREADLAGLFGGIGDPRPGTPPDIFVVLGGMDPSYTLAPPARQDLRGRFAARGFQIHFADGSLNGVPLNNANFGIGGAMSPKATGVPATGALTTAQTRLIRDANVLPSFRAISYFVLLADNAALAAGGTGFGEANAIPGSELVMRVGVAGINDIAWYQSGVLMHELGHLLGLCHPTQSDGTIAGCAAIPVVERDPGATVMGSPAEDPNILDKAIDVLRRPLDYSATQWTQLRLGAGFRP